MNRATLVMLLAATFALTLLLGLAFTAVAARVARRLRFVDRPGGHKSHREPTPYGGGTAIFLAAWTPVGLAALVAAIVPSSWVTATLGEELRVYFGGLHDRAGQALVLLIGATAIHGLGLLDDLRPLGPWLKLLVNLAVSVFVVVCGDVRLGTLWGPLWSPLLTVAWFVVITNAFNFLDNMDGLSAGVAWICLAFLAVCGLMAGQVFVPALACLFLGAVGGFWAHNFPPARIFMGDAGSLLVGYMLAAASVLTTYYHSGAGTPPYALAMPLVILAVPLYDFVSVIVIRLAEGRSPLKGDQRHFSHRLVERGLSRRLAVLTIYLATATTGLAATLLPGADLHRTLVIAIMVVLVLAIIAILESPLRKEP